MRNLVQPAIYGLLEAALKMRGVGTVVPRKVSPKEDALLCEVVSLIRASFAYMEGRIDPPSSMHRLTIETLVEQAKDAEVWVVEDGGRVVACVFLTPQETALYLGKLAVAATHRGRGLARLLVEKARERARDLGLGAVELQSRVELTDNHSAFTALGFTLAGETAHPGFDQSTSLTFVLPI